MKLAKSPLLLLIKLQSVQERGRSRKRTYLQCSSICYKLHKYDKGKVSEWSKVHDWKSCKVMSLRGFESPPFRNLQYRRFFIALIYSFVSNCHKFTCIFIPHTLFDTHHKPTNLDCVKITHLNIHTSFTLLKIITYIEKN